MKHYMKLRGRIIEKYGTLRAFASHLGITQSLLAGKLNKRVRITLDEAYRWSKELEIEPKEMGEYFFD